MTQTRAHSGYGYTSFVKKNMLVFAKMSYLHAPLVHSVGMVERILVTGAGGYIGRHVVKALLDDGQASSPRISA